MCVSPVLELQECFGQGPFGQNISADGIQVARCFCRSDILWHAPSVVEDLMPSCAIIIDLSLSRLRSWA